MRWALAGMAALVIALGTIAFWMSSTLRLDPKPWLPRHIDSPVLAIKMPRSAAEVSMVLRYPTWDHNREVMRGQIFEDWFFIASYGAFFAGLGLLSWRSRLPGSWLLALAIWACIGLAALCDILENRAILRALDSHWIDLTDASAGEIRRASLAKWALIFTTCLLISLLFLGWRGQGVLTQWLAWLAGAAFLAAGIIGVYGLASNPAISTALDALSLALVLVFALFLFFPASFLQGLERRGT